MSSVDSRIVTMKFENSTFESGVRTTLNTLEKLKSSLNFSGQTKGLSDLQTNANRFSLSPLEGAVTGVSKSFIAMSTIAITALSNITTRALVAGETLVKSLTISPISQGLKEYETNLNAIQTILANTGLKGDSGLAKVNAALDKLNTYSDKTIYNFSEMARNIGTFTAAGVKLGPATEAIKGIANLAAVSGSNTQQASSAMYQLSQALASGTVRLIDWNSVNNAGLGGKVFKDAILQTARAHGVAVDQMIKKTGSFRDSLRLGWFSSDILTETLRKFTGDLSKSQLTQLGYSKGQIKGILEMGKTAQDAATKVKTMSQLISTLQETMGSGWAKTFQLLFGNFKEARNLFTGINDVLSGMIQKSSDNRNKILSDFAKLGGRTALIDGLKNSFNALLAVIKPIREAFREIFPAKTGKDLAEAAKSFQRFSEGLKISKITAEDLKRTFAGVFAVFSIIGQVVGGIIGVFKDLFGTVGEGTGGFLNFTGGIGDFLVSVDKALKQGTGLKKFFGSITEILRVPLHLIQALAGYIGALFTGFDGSGATNVVKTLGDLGTKLTPLEALGKRVRSAFDGISSVFSRIADTIRPVVKFIKGAIKDLSNALSNAFSGANFNNTLDAINTALFGGLVLLFHRFVSGGLGGVLGRGRGSVIGTITRSFKNLTNVLGAMQANLKADTLLKIAGAIALMTISIVALSLIDSDKLSKALIAIGIAFGELLAAMAILDKVSSSTGFIKMPFITASLLLLSGAMVLLAAAVKIFSTMSWDELGRGLTGVAGSLVVIAGAMQLMPKSLPLTASGLVLVGVGLASIAGAVKLMSMLSFEEIGRGLLGIAGALVIIAGAMQLMPISLPITAAGLVLVSIGLGAIAGVMKIFATMSFEQMGKGLVGIAGALVLIAGAMQLMPLNLPITAAGLLLVATALGGIAAVAKIFASMSWQELGKAGAALAGALGLIAGGLYLMSGTLLGSAALIVAAGALTILTPVLIALGAMSWESIGKGMVTLAGAFTILGLAGLVLTPLIPSILGLGLALLALGAGLALGGVGALAFATAFGIVVSAGAAGAAVITAILGAIIDSIPKALQAFGNGLVLFANAIATGAPAFTKAFVALLTSLLDAIITVMPKIGKALTTLIQTALKVLTDNTPAMVTAGFKIIMAILAGIENNIANIVTTVGKIVVKFIGALGDQIPKVLEAGAKFIIKFINGLSDTIDKHAEELGTAGGNLARAIIDGMVKGLGSATGISQILSKAADLGKTALSGIAGAIKSHSPSKESEKLGNYVSQGFAIGIVGGQDTVLKAMDTLQTLIKASFEASATEIEAQKARLEKLNADKTPDKGAIKKAEEALAALEALHKQSSDARKILNKDLRDEQKSLIDLGKQYDDITTKLQDANQVLKDAKKTRDDFANSTKDSFSVLPTVDENTTVATYIEAVRKQETDVEKFKASLDTLKTMGLDDVTYAKFLKDGIGIQPFIDQLITAGPAAVYAINTLTAGLGTAAQTLGQTATLELYQAGVDAAQGLVDGLESSLANIEAAMTKIANIIVKTIKKKLKIKSPSREMMDIGKYTNEGLAKGLTAYSGIVEQSAATMANAALDTIKKTMSGISDAVSTEVNVNPVISPVLDLTQIRKDASQIGGLLDANSISASVSYTQASSISADRQAVQATEAQATLATPTTLVSLEQNNYSPKALSPVEIYRQTKNQLALAKEALNA